MEKISYNELDLIEDSINPGVVSSHGDLLDVDVDSNNSVASLGELNGVTPDTTESIHNDTAGHFLRNVLSNLLWSYRPPRFLVHLYSLIVP